MAAACQIGAIVAGAPPAQEEALAQIGLHLGITFQLVDDLLDYTGDQGEIGKEVGADLREGRVTLPLIHALAHAGGPSTAASRSWRQCHPGNGPGNAGLLHQTGSLDYARALARQYTLKAQENLQIFPESIEKGYFWAITEELLRRTH